MIPNELGFLVGSVTWLGVEKSAYPKRNGLKDFGLIDLPYPLRKLTLSPVGTLVAKDNSFEFQIGVKEFPSVGDTVIVPTKEQAKAIVQGQPDGCVKIGTCPTAHDIDIKINPDKMFGRHLAILGNTGGGKSCTVASIVRSAINSVSSCKKPNARFIILDPNGEYSKCFEDLGVKLFKVGQGTKAGVQSFKLSAWIWNGEEWCSILQALSSAILLFKPRVFSKNAVSVLCFSITSCAFFRPVGVIVIPLCPSYIIKSFSASFINASETDALDIFSFFAISTAFTLWLVSNKLYMISK